MTKAGKSVNASIEKLTNLSSTNNACGQISSPIELSNMLDTISDGNAPVFQGLDNNISLRRTLIPKQLTIKIRKIKNKIIVKKRINDCMCACIVKRIL